jgi:hypothetical protein
MRRMFWGLTIATLASAMAMGQDQSSLGDIARANREKQQTQESTGTTPKVITNKDIQVSPPTGIPDANPDDPMTTVSGVQRPARDRDYNSQPANDPFARFGAQRERENLREQIRVQENRIAELQVRIDRANALMHPNGSTAQYEGPMNRAQAMQSQRIAMMQELLERQQTKLAAMQDAARREGMHTTVYDP